MYFVGFVVRQLNLFSFILPCIHQIQNCGVKDEDKQKDACKVLRKLTLKLIIVLRRNVIKQTRGPLVLYRSPEC